MHEREEGRERKREKEREREREEEREKEREKERERKRESACAIYCKGSVGWGYHTILKPEWIAATPRVRFSYVTFRKPAFWVRVLSR